MASTIEVIRVGWQQRSLPFIEKTDFLSPGEDPLGVVLAQKLEFNGTPGEITLIPICPSDKLDNFQTPLGEVRKEVVYKDGRITEVNLPLKPCVSFVIHTLKDWQVLLEHRPRLYLGHKSYDVVYIQELQAHFENLVRIGGGGIRVEGSLLLTPPGFNKPVPVLLPHHLPTLAHGITLIM